MYWKNLFEIIQTDEKLHFLEELLEKNETIRSQFIARFKRESTEDSSITKEVLIRFYEEEKAEILEKLEALDFVNFDWEDYIPPHGGYIPEYEACTHLAEDMVQDVLSGPVDEIMSYIRNGQIAEGSMLFAATYQACTEAYYEENYAFDNTEEAFLELFQPAYDDLLKEIKSVITNPHQVLQLFHALFSQYSGFNQDLKYFEPLLQVLIQNNALASDVKIIINQYNIDEETLPRLLLQIHELMGNQEYWLNHAESYYTKDKEIAEKLMSYYLKENREAFLRIAEEVFNTYKYTFDLSILQNLDVKANRELYKKILSRHVECKENIDDYKILSELLSPEEKEIFFAKMWNKVFLTKIFEFEKMYDRILQLVHSHNDAWEFNEIIQPILPIYPTECLSVLQNKIIRSLNNERGRSAYQRIVSWIKLILEIPGASAKAQDIIRITYAHKPNLPALKDEMKTAGLV
ncbi:hypothetical protein BH23BAC1_BH23BAC1_49490 [soil metagenome]